MQARGLLTILYMHTSHTISPPPIPGKSHGNHPEKLKPLLCGFLSGKTSGKGLTDVPVMHGLPLHCWPLTAYDSCMEDIPYFMYLCAYTHAAPLLHAGAEGHLLLMTN